MSNKKIVLTSEFRVKSPNGEEATVNEHTEFISEAALSSPENWTEGMSNYRFSDGSWANKLPDGGFQRLSDGETFTVISEKILTEQ